MPGVTKYDNYRPYRTIVLNSEDATKTLVSKTIATVVVDVCQNYRYDIDLGSADLRDCRFNVKSFNMKHNALIVTLKYVGGVYLKSYPTITQYNSGGTANGYLLLSQIFANNDIIYNNSDIIDKGIPITDVNMFQSPIDLYIQSNQRDDANESINGLIDTENFILEILISKLDEEATLP